MKITKFLKIILVIALFFSIKGSATAAVSTNVNLTIRDGATIVFSGVVPLPTGITSLNDNTNASHAVDANSVLAVLANADNTSSAFNISNLAYYSSFGSFYLKCITDFAGNRCDNWQYTVNNSYPSVGMDKNILTGGENIYVYFGPQNKISLSLNDIKTNDTLTVTAQKYNYLQNLWTARTGVNVGLTQPDPNNPFSPKEIQTGAVDANGKAVFSSIPVGSYDVGIKEDFYFPTEHLTVSSTPSGSGPILVANPSSTTSSSSVPTGIISPSEKKVFDQKKAFQFLIAQQKNNGSFDEDLYTDWAAIALAVGNNQDQTIKLVKYLGETKIDKGFATDYERRAMALMALGLNPYNTNGENYIEKIIANFDGKQFGDKDQDNDDIFALIVLQNAGYKQDEKIITDTINFILSKQKENGSWDESVDMTGAGIEALSAFNQNENVKGSLIKAENFLRINQKDNGSWGNNASSTAWALEGINALGEHPENWIKYGNSPFDYLAFNQNDDGGINNNNLKNKIWETSYVASIISGKTWNQIMQKFEKQENKEVAEVKQEPVQNENKEISKTIKHKNNVAKMKSLNLAKENTASVINAVSPSEQNPKKGWFSRFLENIFGF